jgi:hypothetical protein
MATLQTLRKSEHHFETLCDKHLTIGTRHGISSTHDNVTIEKVAHRIPNEIPRDDTHGKRKEKNFFFFLSFLFFFLFLFYSPSPRVVNGACAIYYSGTPSRIRSRAVL